MSGVDYIRVATTHAIAYENDSITETKGKLLWLDKNRGNGTWICMGDFNSPPWAYLPYGVNLSANMETLTRYQGDKRAGWDCNVLSDCKPTQGPNGKRTSCIDFAFTSYPHLNFQVKWVNNITIMGGKRNQSDHNLITVQMTV